MSLSKGEAEVRMFTPDPSTNQFINRVGADSRLNPTKPRIGHPPINKLGG